MSLKHTLDRRWYPDFQDQWNGRAFRARALAQITPQSRMLDIGAGRGATEIMRFKGLVAERIGTDVDPAVLQNTDVDRAVHTPDRTLLGVEDASCDVVVSKHVLEHVEDPPPAPGALCRRNAVRAHSQRAWSRCAQGGDLRDIAEDRVGLRYGR